MQQNEQKKLTGEADQAQIDAWKKQSKYGIYAVQVDGHIGYFKNPNLHEANCAAAKQDDTKPFAVTKELAEVCWLGGSEEILNNDQLFMSAAAYIKASIGNKTATLVNL